MFHVFINFLDDDPHLEEFLQDINDLEDPENLNELVFGYDASDEARICRFTRKDGTCYKGKNCKLEHVPLPKGGFTTDQMLTYRRTIDDLELPGKGETVQVLVTGWVDSCTYLVQFVRNASRDNAGIFMDKDTKDLIAAMNHPKVCAKFEPFKVAPAHGEIVLAFHYMSKMWMRAVVRSTRANNIGVCESAEVYMADFGEHLNVKMKDLRRMTEDFIKLPFQAVEIYLYNFERNPTCDDNQARRFYEKHMMYRNFVATIRSSVPPFSVKLTTLKGHEIGATLLNKGYAVKRERDYNVDDNSVFQLPF